MDYVRIGGVCLLLMVLAAALPADVLAQASESSSGAAPSISHSLLSGSSAQESSISAETLSKRNIGLKPLGSKSSAPSSAAASDQSAAQASSASAATATQAATAPAAAPATTSQVSSQQESSGSATTPVSNDIITPDQISQDTVAADASTDSAATTPAEAASSGTSSTSGSASEVVTPPEDVAAGTVVSATDSAADASNAAAENATDEQPTDELTAENESENQTESEEDEEEEIEVGEKNRIWSEGSSLKYTWTPETFSGFFYDLENEVGTERLTVDLVPNERSLESGQLTYSTKPQVTDFEFEDWGKYEVIGFMAEKYFAGFKASDILSDDRSLINDGQLRRVLVDSDEEKTVTTGSVLPLEEGYELRIKQIDIDGNKVYMALAKDGDEIDSKVIDPSNLDSSTYNYEVEVSGEDTSLILAHISNVFASTESALVTIDGLFQISDTYASVEDGDKYGKMEVKSVSDEGVEMENEDSLTLRRGSTVEIFGDVSFLVADADELRFAPFVEKTGSYDVRGTVINPSNTSEFTWTPYNFEGFYYDIDDDVGTETMTMRISGGSKIEEGDLEYSTKAQPVKFEFNDWGKYDVIGFMADKYFAGYNNQTEFTDESSVIGEGQLRRVLMDSDDSRTIASGSVLSLEEGYELRIKQVDLNGNKVYLALAKDGDEVDSKVVTPSNDPTDGSSNYLYKIDMGGEKDVPLIAAHVESVFRSTESDLATVDAIFQISDSPESVEEGEMHGKMKVETLDYDGITLANDGTISLSRGKDVDIMDNLRIQVADSDKRLLAPIATKTGEGTAISLTVSGAVVDKAAQIAVRSGTSALSGVAISIDGNTIGTTDSTGSISYIPKSTGTLKVVARKTGYNDATADMVVRTAEEASQLTAAQRANVTLANQLILNAPAEVSAGENFLITITEGINQTPVAGAQILLDDNEIGNTSSQGTFTYAVNLTGEHSLKVEKEGYSSASRKIMVTSALEVMDLTLPETANAKQSMKISAVVHNKGSEVDTITLNLMVNDTLAESKNVTVKAGENSTVQFSYNPDETGLHRFSLNGKAGTVNVEEAQTSNWLIGLILV
ncbi:MAG: S-layer protein domain-containing protein, partial [Methanothrix soehngenii]|nr:S-layer protein domain-containing protein [Methanothrix soehngenii]